MKNNDLFKNKVYQRITNENNGDCMKCCIATLFNKNYEQIPNFIEEKDWGKSIQETLNSFGYKSYKVLFNEKFQKYILNPKKSCFKNIEIYKNSIINKINLSKFPGINIKGKKIMLGTVVSSQLFDHDKTIDYMFEHQHMVLIDEKCNIVFDPNLNNKGIIRYPFSTLIGFHGVTEIWELKKL